MKTGANASTDRTADPTRPKARGPLLGLCFLLPFLMGGCPEFRNDVVGVIETATRSALLGTEDEWTIAHAARGSLVDATINLLFGQFQGVGSD